MKLWKENFYFKATWNPRNQRRHGTNVFLGPNARLVKTIAKKNPDVSDRLSHTHGTKVMKITKSVTSFRQNKSAVLLLTEQ